MKTLGILGGMGPKATAVLYDRIVDSTCAEKDQEHIRTVILSDTSIPDRTEAILCGETTELRKKLMEDAKQLEAAGAEIIVMPCNTAHCFADDIRAGVGCTLVDMVDEAAREALSMSEKGSIGILATDGTVASKIYDTVLGRYDGKAIYPSEEGQKKLMSIIYDQIKSGERVDREAFIGIMDGLLQNCDVMILACTELSLLKAAIPEGIRYVDAMDSAVSAVIDACEGRRKQIKDNR